MIYLHGKFWPVALVALVAYQLLHKYVTSEQLGEICIFGLTKFGWWHWLHWLHFHFYDQYATGMQPDENIFNLSNKIWPVALVALDAFPLLHLHATSRLPDIIEFGWLHWLHLQYATSM